MASKTRPETCSPASGTGYCHFVCCLNGEPAGYVGVVENDIRIATHPDKQRRGAAAFMLGYMTARFPTARAKIKVENTASLALFANAGFITRYYLLERAATTE